MTRVSVALEDVLAARMARLDQRARQRRNRAEKRLEREVPLLLAAGLVQAPTLEQAKATLREADEAFARAIAEPTMEEPHDEQRARLVGLLSPETLEALDRYCQHTYPRHYWPGFYRRTAEGAGPLDLFLLRTHPVLAGLDPERVWQDLARLAAPSRSEAAA